MTEDKAMRVVLPTFTLTQLCSKNDKGAMERVVSLPNTEPTTYYYRPVQLSQDRGFNVNGLDLVLNPDGSPWLEACLYILYKIEESLDHKTVAKCSGIAGDLTAFRQFLHEHNIDFLIFPLNKQKRPTYRYRAHIKSRVRSGEIAISTAKRFMQSVIGFYRWLQAERKYEPENPMWIDSDRYINFTDSVGFAAQKCIKTTNLSISSASSVDPTDTRILDGGKLRPLAMDEQVNLIKILFELGNTEMTLIHLFALFAGARIQTVLTLKIRHFRAVLPDDLTEVRLACGPSTSIDTKNDKKLTLHIPRWLNDHLSTYSYSERAVRRRVKSVRGDSEDNYLFLSNRGSPFYADSQDLSQFNPNETRRYNPTGGAVRTFIADHVIPKLKAIYGSNYSYNFHDLRATFGMNLTDAYTEAVQNGDMTLTQARNMVRDLMCHESFATTDLYLNYREHTKTVALTQEKYQEHLKSLSDAANIGLKELAG